MGRPALFDTEAILDSAARLIARNGTSAASASAIAREMAVHGFVAQFSEPGQEASRAGLFGPVVPVPDDAPLLDRVLGLTGRDPAWSAP